MLRKSIAILALLAVVGFVFAGEEPAPTKTDPKGTEVAVQKHPWGSFKVGSTVTMRNSGMGVMSEMKMTLVNLDADFATVKSEMKMGENTMPATEMKMPLKGYAMMAGSTVKELSKKNEDLKIGDKTFACEVIEIEETMTAGKSVRTTWYCKDAPTGMLQMVTKMKMGETETTSKTTVSKLEETIKVADKEVKCIVFETVSDGAMGKSTSKLWQTDQIPGFSAKMETEMKMGENVMKSTMEVVTFEVK